MAKFALYVFGGLMAAASALSSLYDLGAVDINGKWLALSEFNGNITVVINIATCSKSFTASNYGMLKRLQLQYAKRSVRFLLVPYNQFGEQEQEPKSNAQIKAFVETYVDLSIGSNVLLLAKSNVNGVQCTTARADACMPSSEECCPANDAINNYVLGAVPRGKLLRNFHKMVVDVSGKPFPGESILHVDDDLDLSLEAALAAADNRVGISLEAVAPSRWGFLVVLSCFILFGGGVALFMAGMGMKKMKQREVERQQELAPHYILLA